ncbi:hypothetical protein D3C79_1022700 [compost metagenome]
MMENKVALFYMRVLVQMVDTIRIEQRRSPLDTVNLIPLTKKQLGQVGTILTGNARNECNFHTNPSIFLLATCNST